MKTFKLLLIFNLTFGFCSMSEVEAQNIGINGTGANAHASALLDVDAAPANNTGLLIPRIPLQATNLAAPVTSPATSLLVYNTATASAGSTAVMPGYYYWDGTKWVRFQYTNGTAQDWNLLGNAGTNPTTNFLGTTDAQDLVFKTNNLEAIRIFTNSNVQLTRGSLDVLGTSATVGTTLTGFASQIVIRDLAGSPSSGIGWVNSTLFNLGTAGAADVMIKTSNTEKMRITTSGNVGIGTVAPFYQLEVKGTAQAMMQVESNTSGLTYLDIRNTNTATTNNGSIMRLITENAIGTGVTSADVGKYANGTMFFNNWDNSPAANSIFCVGTNTSSSTGLERMRITSLGNVGINNSTPNGKLQVIDRFDGAYATTVGIFGGAKLPGVSVYDNSDYVGLTTEDIDGNLLTTNDAASVLYWGDDGNEPFYFKNLTWNGTGSNPQTIMTLLPTGNVGIGTTIPTAKLHVNAGANIDNGLFESNNTDGTLLNINNLSNNQLWAFNVAGTSPTTPNVQVRSFGIVNRTSNTIPFTILNNNNIGIGTANPQTALSIINGNHTGLLWNGTSNIDGVEIDRVGYVSAQRSNSPPLLLSKPLGYSDNRMASFIYNGSEIGTISTSGVSTAYNTTSDIRLKENIKTSVKGLYDVMKIEVKDYNYKADETKKIETGFIAQELYEVYPQAVHKGGDNAKTNPWMIDYGKLTPLLIKGMQEQQAQIELQKQEIYELKKQYSEILQLLKTK